jgi:hypothetical protein
MRLLTDAFLKAFVNWNILNILKCYASLFLNAVVFEVNELKQLISKILIC